MIVLEEKVKMQQSYEVYFPKVKVIKDKDFYVINEDINENDYLKYFITKQPTIKCLEAWFEGVVKGICKPRIMYGEMK